MATKKGRSGGSFSKRHPAGVKTHVLMIGLIGTTKVVPFQSSNLIRVSPRCYLGRPLQGPTRIVDKVNDIHLFIDIYLYHVTLISMGNME
jgi:hypothetical protein